jgi:SAM-dependent methyltransferase
VIDSALTFIQWFHRQAPKATSMAMSDAVLADGRNSYQWMVDATMRLVSESTHHPRILDLGCGDGVSSQLAAQAGVTVIALDASIDELQASVTSSAVHPMCAKAQALPLADGSMQAAMSHMAFMLMTDPPTVVSELARVLVAGAPFVASVGGGPPADGPPEAFACYLDALSDVLGASGALRPRLGDVRSKSEQGWNELFSSHDFQVAPFVREVLFFDDDIERVWNKFSQSYDLTPGDDPMREQVRQRFFARAVRLCNEQGKVAARWVLWQAVAIRGGRR